MEPFGLTRDIVAWVLPLLICYLAWPILKRKRAYVVAAAVLCLTPSFVRYEGIGAIFTIWPLVLCIPAYLMGLPQSVWGLVYMVLPAGSFIGLITWYSSRWIVQGGN
jgi:hypothetical protein